MAFKGVLNQQEIEEILRAAEEKATHESQSGMD
jgi:hypothetical protein